MWETGYYVNTGIQLAFILQFPYLYSILFDIYFYTLTLTYRAFYNNNLKSTVCYTTAPLKSDNFEMPLWSLQFLPKNKQKHVA